MEELKFEKNEIKFVPIKSEPIIEEVREQPLVDQRDMTVFAQIIISALITYLMIDKRLFDGTDIQLYCFVSFAIFVLTMIQHKITRRIVRMCRKGKSHPQRGD